MASREGQLLDECVRNVLGVHDDAHIYQLPFPRGYAFSVIQGYGGSFSHTGRLHYSIDFAMAIGHPVCAARSGNVVRIVDSFEVGGPDRSLIDHCNLVEIQHSDRSLAAYVHLATKGVLVRKNQFVHEGEVIAFAGNSGWSAGPHLHFHVISACLGRPVATLFRTHRGIARHLEAGHHYAHPSNRYKVACLQAAFPNLTAAAFVLRQRLHKRLCTGSVENRAC
jgi:murein DD-endopeptidase MepM/ murein hydrolase activator NlpD